MTASAWKTSAGAAARVPVAQVVNLTRQLKAYQEAGCMVIGLAADGEVSLPDLDLADGPLVIVVGSEGKGLSRLVAETCDQLVSIPMASTLESLNAGRRCQRHPLRRGPEAGPQHVVDPTGSIPASGSTRSSRALGFVLVWLRRGRARVGCAVHPLQRGHWWSPATTPSCTPTLDG